MDPPLRHIVNKLQACYGCLRAQWQNMYYYSNIYSVQNQPTVLFFLFPPVCLNSDVSTQQPQRHSHTHTLNLPTFRLGGWRRVLLSDTFTI